MLVSNCCGQWGSPLEEDMKLCSKCGEYCEYIPHDCFKYEEQEIKDLYPFWLEEDKTKPNDNN